MDGRVVQRMRVDVLRHHDVQTPPVSVLPPATGAQLGDGVCVCVGGVGYI